MRILLVEDHLELSRWVGRALEKARYTVERSLNGADADARLATERYDLVILDLSLARLDGLEVLRRLRARGNRTPVLIVTARAEVSDRVRGLDLGADDYLAKPFEIDELEARVRALIRRANALASSEIVHGRLRLDMAGRRLSFDGQPVELSARELAVVELLLMREGRVVTKQQIIDHLYGWDDVSSVNAVEVFVYRLRRKLAFTGVDIKTVRGMGYLIEKAGG